MSFILSSEVQRLIEERLQSGGYESPDDLIVEALESLRSRDDGIEAHKGAWREELDRRYDDATKGTVEWVDGNEAARRLADRHRAHRRQ